MAQGQESLDGHPVSGPAGQVDVIPVPGTPPSQLNAGETINGSGIARETYLKRRAYIDNAFLGKDPVRTEVDIMNSEGQQAHVNVFSNVCEIPPALRSTKPGETDPSTADVSIYVPGLFEIERRNSGNTIESKLAGAIVTGDLDLMMILKAEGTDAASYQNEGQQTVTRASREVLINILRDYLNKHPEKHNLRVSVIGYSEGAHQGVSTAMRIFELGQILGAETAGNFTFGRKINLTLDGYTSYGGGGLTGYANQSEVDAIDYMIRVSAHMQFEDDQTAKARKQATGIFARVDVISDNPKLKGATLPVPVTDETLQSGLVVTKFRPDLVKGIEIALQKDTLNPASDVYNVGKWFYRFLRSGFSQIDLENERSAQTLAARLGGIGKLKTLQKLLRKLPELGLSEVPFERLKAIMTINQDYEALVAAGVPLRVLGCSNDMFFPPQQIRTTLEGIIGRHPGAAAKIQYFETPFSHDEPHSNPSGLAYLMEILTQRRNNQNALLQPSADI